MGDHVKEALEGNCRAIMPAMGIEIIVVLLCYGVGLSGTLWGEARESPRIKLLFKPLASTGFILAALLSGALRSDYGVAILVGLSLSFLGDVLLISMDLRAFRGGLVSFLLGHVAYAVAFAGLGPAWGWCLGAGVPLLVVAAVVMRWLGPHLGKMFLPVVAYMVVITIMVILATGTVGHPVGGAVRVAGAVAFFLSDLSVARDRFVAKAFINRAWGLPMYYGGQLLLAYSCIYTAGL